MYVRLKCFFWNYFSFWILKFIAKYSQGLLSLEHHGEFSVRVNCIRQFVIRTPRTKIHNTTRGLKTDPETSADLFQILRLQVIYLFLREAIDFWVNDSEEAAHVAGFERDFSFYAMS